jgi:hypothetical protein
MNDIESLYYFATWVVTEPYQSLTMDERVSKFCIEYDKKIEWTKNFNNYYNPENATENEAKLNALIATEIKTNIFKFSQKLKQLIRECKHILLMAEREKQIQLSGLRAEYNRSIDNAKNFKLQGKEDEYEASVNEAFDYEKEIQALEENPYMIECSPYAIARDSFDKKCMPKIEGKFDTHQIESFLTYLENINAMIDQLQEPIDNIEEVINTILTQGNVSIKDFPYLSGFRARISDIRDLLEDKDAELISTPSQSVNKFGRTYTYMVHHIQPKDFITLLKIYTNEK